MTTTGCHPINPIRSSRPFARVDAMRTPTPTSGDDVPTRTTALILMLALSVLTSAIVAISAVAVARWNGNTIPQSLTVAGRAAATTLMLCLTATALVLTANP